MKLLPPPKAKIYEALSAVLDGRVEVVGPQRAVVSSSSGENRYTVTWSEDLSAFGSSDKATIFQGYIGYPIIAVLLQIGMLDFDAGLASPLKGVNWKKINADFRRDYDRAVDSVLAGIGDAEVAVLRAMVDRIAANLARLELERLGSRKP